MLLDNLAKHLNDSVSAEGSVKLLGAVKKEGVRLGALVENDDGTVSAAPLTLNDTEALRIFINTTTDSTHGPTLRHSSLLKNAIDSTTENAGGKLFKEARAARKRYADDYENVALVNDLMNTKRGTNDRKIAMENSVNKISNASLETIRHLRKVLNDEGDDGQQAWREIQGGVIRKIRDTALRRSVTNERSDRIVSASALDKVISDLANSGKLEAILGKQQSDKMLLLRDVALDILTAPPGQVNHSNTATILAMMFDLAMTGATGVPAPIASITKWVSGEVKSRRLKARIEKALKGFEENDR